MSQVTDDKTHRPHDTARLPQCQHLEECPGTINGHPCRIKRCCQDRAGHTGPHHLRECGRTFGCDDGPRTVPNLEAPEGFDPEAAPAGFDPMDAAGFATAPVIRSHPHAVGIEAEWSASEGFGYWIDRPDPHEPRLTRPQLAELLDACAAALSRYPDTPRDGDPYDPPTLHELAAAHDMTPSALLLLAAEAQAAKERDTAAAQAAALSAALADLRKYNRPTISDLTLKAESWHVDPSALIALWTAHQNGGAL